MDSPSRTKIPLCYHLGVELIIFRVTGLLSARLILKLREWSDGTLVQVSACKRTGQAETPQPRSVINLSFHAATVEHLTSSTEFGKDYLDYVHDDLDVDGGDHASLP